MKMADLFFSYYWYLDEDEQDITSIRIYGLDKKNRNICLRIDDFAPYIYLELPVYDKNKMKINWNSSIQFLANKLDDLLKDQKPLEKKLVYKYKLYGAELDKDGKRKLFPYLKCSFSSKNDYKKLSFIVKKSFNIFGLGEIKLKMHEQDASPVLQLISVRDIPTAGWIKFKGEEVKGDEKITICDREYIVSYKHIAKYDKNTVAKPKLMGFDIEVNSSNPSAMPNSTKQGDKIFQISCVFTREGDTEENYKLYLLTLGKVDLKLLGDGNIIPLMFKTEADLLEGFTELVRTENPNVIVGYNIFKFDIKYMIDRSNSNWTFNCFNNFSKIGFHKYNMAKKTEISWSSSAFKNQNFIFLDAEGRLFVDLLPLIQRDFKLNNYQLKTVSKEFLKDTKDDLSVKGIFKCYRIGMKKDNNGEYSKKAIKAMSLVGKYCLKDSILVIKLMGKLQSWVGLCEMAKTTNVPIFDVYTQGQQRKVYSQLYKFCLHNNIVVEKDAYISKENERYVGAHVFPPVPGNYERVLPFDFCFSGDTLVTMSNGLSKRIDSFDKDKLLLAFNKEENCFENYSFINGLQRKGIRNTVKVYFQDGSSIVATPEHKFMLENGEWCQAKDLKDKYVKAGIKYPEDKECILEKDWSLEVKGYNFNMKDDLEREKSLAFARMVGYILADGSIYETTCSRGYTRKCVEACFGTLFDALTFKRDIKLFSDVDVTIRKRDGNGDKDREKKGTTQCITLPANISYMIHSLEDIMTGKRSTQETKLPKFILDEKCPLSIVREFLGGLFGGDGTACCLSTKDVVNSISFKWTVIKNYINSMNNTFIQIKNLLEKLKVYDSSILKPIKINYTNQTISPSDYLTNPRYNIELRLILDSTIVFMKNIGFRYCINKQGKSYFISMYLEMKEKTREQRIKILDRTNELIDKNIDNVFSRKKNNMKFSDCLDIARKELLKNEPALYPISLSSSYDLTYDRHERIKHPDKPRKYSLYKKKFPSPSTYFKDINVLEWFENKKHFIKSDDVTLPCFRQKVIDVRENESLEVFDIEVDKVHNFLANGITVSNCSLYPTTIIAYNFDYSTLVNDPSIPDSMCNIMDWQDCLGCIVKGSNVTINGFGFPIEILKNNNNLILSHSDKTNLLEYKNQINFFYRGKKECIEILFQDGTILKCTPDHKIMTENNEWVEAKDLIINNTRVKKGITYPITNFENYISDFTISNGLLKLTMDTYDNIEKFCKFARIFGFLYTNGAISKNRATCFVGDIVDAYCLIDDIKNISNENVIPKYINNGNSSLYYIRIPHSIHQSCIWKLGDGYGRRVDKKSSLPSFIVDVNCPKIIKREFLAGMFGGDGLSPSFCEKTNKYTYPGLCASKYLENLENLKDFFIDIKNILKKDFNINSYLSGPYKKKDEKSYMMFLNIYPNDLIKFYELIGYRYCTYKMNRLEILCSYKRLINNVFDQRQRCFYIIHRLKNTMSWDEAVIKAHKIMKKREIIYNEHYSLPNKNASIDALIRPRNGNKKTFWSNNFPSFKSYLEELGVKDLFIDNKNDIKISSIYGKKQNEIDTIPFYTLKIINIRNIGIQEVYDLEIKENHSFLANGVVVHNCNHDPKVIKYNKLTKYIEDKKDELKKLRIERDNKLNKLIRNEYVEKINKLTEELKPYIKERSDIKKTIPKNPMCEKRYYRFLKPEILKGVVPTLLQNLLDARKNTRKEIKENIKIIEKLNEDLSNNEEKIKELEDLNKVLEKRQLSYKVCANSMYGIMGVKKGLLPFMPGAMACTYMGRTNIEKVAETITKKYGGKLVYGDTDSNYINFPHLKTAEESWDYALKVSDEVSALFPKPINL